MLVSGSGRGNIAHCLRNRFPEAYAYAWSRLAVAYGSGYAQSAVQLAAVIEKDGVPRVHGTYFHFLDRHLSTKDFQKFITAFRCSRRPHYSCRRYILRLERGFYYGKVCRITAAPAKEYSNEAIC